MTSLAVSGWVLITRVVTLDISLTAPLQPCGKETTLSPFNTRDPEGQAIKQVTQLLGLAVPICKVGLKVPPTQGCG